MCRVCFFGSLFGSFSGVLSHIVDNNFLVLFLMPFRKPFSDLGTQKVPKLGPLGGLAFASCMKSETWIFETPHAVWRGPGYARRSLSGPLCGASLGRGFWGGMFCRFGSMLGPEGAPFGISWRSSF